MCGGCIPPVKARATQAESCPRASTESRSRSPSRGRSWRPEAPLAKRPYVEQHRGNPPPGFVASCCKVRPVPGGDILSKFIQAAVAAFAVAFAATAHADITIAQVAPLSGVLASTGKQMVVGG